MNRSTSGLERGKHANSGGSPRVIRAMNAHRHWRDEAGGFSNEILIPHGGSTVFYDFERPNHSMSVITPVFVMSWEPICTPDPDISPPQPPCRQNPYCLRVASVALD